MPADSRIPSASMRWENLFDDLESQLERELSADDIDLEMEDERLRLGRLGLRDRVVSAKSGSATVRTTLRGGRILDLRPLAFGRDWFSADIISVGSRPRQCIVPVSAIDSLSLTPQQVAGSLRRPTGADAGALSDRLGLAFVLRDLARRRAPVTVMTGDPDRHGTIDRVGRDHVDLALHPADEPRRRVAEIRVIPFDRLGCLLLE